MGDGADDILRSFKLSAEDAKKYQVVKDNFEGQSWNFEMWAGVSPREEESIIPTTILSHTISSCNIP